MIPLLVLLGSTAFNALLLGTAFNAEGPSTPETGNGTFDAIQDVAGTAADFTQLLFDAATWNFPGFPIWIRVLIVGVLLVGSIVWAFLQWLRGV